MYRNVSALVLGLALMLISGSHARASAAQRAVPCTGASLRALGNHTHAKLNPCVAKPHQLIFETTYYQNASKVGGTALAAYPEARVRYGVTPHIEAFIDTPSEIAKSGIGGAGIYVMTHAGVGVKIEFARLHGVVYSLSAESHPPMNALANMDLVPLSDVHMNANWSANKLEMGVEFGVLNYAQLNNLGRRTAATAAFSLTRSIDSKTSVTSEFGFQSAAALGALAQTSATLSVQRELTPRLLFNVEIGTAFNATGGSKPHYLGAGFVMH